MPPTYINFSKAKIARLQTELLDWYQKTCRDLPWRTTKDPYCIWVSEVMLQQTQVKTVIPYYRNFIRLFPTVHNLAASDLQAVLKAWEGMGYYARARNLHKAAHMVVTTYQGKLPDTHQEIRKLPGIGDYIAAAVLSIAFRKPHAVVDGNVKRVLARLFCVKEAVNHPPSHKLFQGMATALLDRETPDRFNQAVMELGALVCKPDTPECDHCPLIAYCCAYIKNLISDYPKRVSSKHIPTYHIATGVILKNGRMLITQRKPDGLLGGLWEFPGGKVKNKESAIAACAREIKEETNIAIDIVEPIARINHAYTHFKIIMDVFYCRYRSGKIKLRGPVDHRWIQIEDIGKYPFPKANHKFFGKLKKMKKNFL